MQTETFCECICECIALGNEHSLKFSGKGDRSLELFNIARYQYLCWKIEK